MRSVTCGLRVFKCLLSFTAPDGKDLLTSLSFSTSAAIDTIVKANERKGKRQPERDRHTHVHKKERIGQRKRHHLRRSVPMNRRRRRRRTTGGGKHFRNDRKRTR